MSVLSSRRRFAAVLGDTGASELRVDCYLIKFKDCRWADAGLLGPENVADNLLWLMLSYKAQHSRSRGQSGRYPDLGGTLTWKRFSMYSCDARNIGGKSKTHQRGHSDA